MLFFFSLEFRELSQQIGLDFFSGWGPNLTQPMDPEKKSLNFIFPTKNVIPKSLKFSHWPSK